MSNPNGAAASRARRDPALAVQCACTALVALGATYASYRHGRDFAQQFGADHATAAIWPLIVDGLLMIATVELWKPDDTEHADGRWAAWVAFIFGISLSLCANIGSAPDLSVLGVAVAACPPLALLLTVELLNRALKHHRVAIRDLSKQRAVEQPATEPGCDATVDDLAPPGRLEQVADWTAEERMSAHYLAEQAEGRTPTGADLDRVAGTHNYGRRMLRNWRLQGKIAQLAETTD